MAQPVVRRAVPEALFWQTAQRPWTAAVQGSQALWGLRLPSGQQLPQAMGEPHLHACLAALAVDGKSAAPH